MTDAKKPGKLTGTKRAVKATATKKATKKAPATMVSAKVEEPVLRDETPTEAEIAEMEAMQEVLDAAEPEPEAVEEAEPEVKIEKTVKVAHSSAPDVVAKVGRVLVERHFTKAGKLVDSDGSEELLEVKTFLAPPANVGVGYGATINLGDYNSAKVNVLVNVPCYTEEIDGAILFASGVAEKRVRREVAEIKGEELPEEEEVPEEEQDLIPEGEEVEAEERGDVPIEESAGEEDDDVIDEPRPADVTEADFNLDDDDEEEEEDDDTEIEGFDEFDDLPEID